VITRTRARWIGEKKFETGPDGRTHLIDAAASVAPGPVEAFLGAIATCSAVDVLDILSKRRTPVERLEIDVQAERRPIAPRRVRGLNITYSLDGTGIDVVHAERAVKLALQKYCSVAASISADITLSATVNVNGLAGSPMILAVWCPADDMATPPAPAE
jgi:putative redox protein